MSLNDVGYTFNRPLLSGEIGELPGVLHVRRKFGLDLERSRFNRYDSLQFELCRTNGNRPVAVGCLIDTVRWKTRLVEQFSNFAQR